MFEHSKAGPTISELGKASLPQERILPEDGHDHVA